VLQVGLVVAVVAEVEVEAAAQVELAEMAAS
jgi:hypothetical protein